MNDFGEMSNTGGVLSNQEMRIRRKKRGECESCGRKCFKRNLFKLIPITSESDLVLKGRCLTCRPLGSEGEDYDTAGSGGSGSGAENKEQDYGGDGDGDGDDAAGAVDFGGHIMEANVRRPSAASSTVSEDTSTRLARRNQRLSRNGNQSLSNLVERRSAMSNGRSHSGRSIHQQQQHSFRRRGSNRSYHSNDTDNGRDYGREKMVRAFSEPGSSFANEAHHTQRHHQNNGYYAKNYHQDSFYEGSEYNDYAGSESSHSTSSSKSVDTTMISRQHPSIVEEQQEGDEKEIEMEPESNSISRQGSELSLRGVQGEKIASIEEYVKERTSTSEKQSDTTSTSNVLPPYSMGKSAIGVAAALHLQKDFRARKEKQTKNKSEKVPHTTITTSTAGGGGIASFSSNTPPSPQRKSQEERDMETKRAIRNSRLESKESSRLDRHIDEKLRNASVSSKNSPTNEQKEIMMKHGEGKRKSSFKDDVMKPPPTAAAAATTTSNMSIDSVLEIIQNAPGNSYTYTEILDLSFLYPSNSQIQHETIHFLSQSVHDLKEEDYQIILNLGTISKIIVKGIMSSTPTQHHHATKDFESKEENPTENKRDILTDACLFLSHMIKVINGEDNGITRETREKLLLTMGREGCIEAVIHAMDTSKENIQVQETSIFILSILGQIDENQLRILKCGGIRNIIQAMSNHSELISLHLVSCQSFCHLAAHNPSMRTAIANGGGCEKMSVAMIVFSNSIDLVESSLDALVAICKNVTQNKLRAIESGAIDSIVSTMQVHRDSADIQASAAKTIWTIGSSEETASLVGEFGGIDVIVRAMWVHSDSPNVQKWTCKALHVLSVSPTNQALMVDIGGITSVVNAMQGYSDDASIQEDGCATLANIAQLSDGVQGQIVAEEAIDAISIAMVLHGDNAHVQEKACSALLHIACEANFYPLQAANVLELMKAAAVNFPAECGELETRMSSMLSGFHQSL